MSQSALEVTLLQAKAAGDPAVAGLDIKKMLAAVAPFAWRVFDEHAEDEIFKKRIIFFTLTLRVSQARFLMVLLFGERPYTAIAGGAR